MIMIQYIEKGEYWGRNPFIRNIYRVTISIRCIISRIILNIGCFVNIAVCDLSDIAANLDNSSNDENVRVNYDAHWDHPSADDENKDEDSRCRIVGYIIETTSREVTFGHIFSDPKERQRCEEG